MNRWIDDAILYHIYPLGFCGAPRTQTGSPGESTLEKVVEWIPHLQKLGVNTVYFGPVFNSSEHGYDTRDYYHADPRLGGDEALRRTCQALHQQGIRVVLDGVFNHVGRDFWAFADVRKNQQSSPYVDWFAGLNFGGGSPMGDPFWYEGWNGHYNLVKLNLKNPAVVEHLLGAVGEWIDRYDIDGLRLDAADCVELDFFRRLRQYVAARKPDFWLVGEIIHGDYNRWANEELLDSVTNYELYKGLYSAHNDHNYFEIAHSLGRQFGSGGIYRTLYTYNFVDNHDVNRLASTLRDRRHLKNVYTLLYTAPGLPTLYYGSEWGIEGVKAGGDDSPMRPCLRLEEMQRTGDGALCDHLARLGALRHRLPALRRGGYEAVVIRNEQLVYRRFAGEDALWVALNLADAPFTLEWDMPQGEYVDLLSGERFVAQNGRMALAVPGCSGRILAPAQQAEPSPEPSSERPSLSSAPREAPSIGCAGSEADSPRRVGRYRHFKGGEYRLLHLARHSETGEEMAVYVALYGEGGIWVRPAEMFFGTVRQGDALCPRFTYIGP